MEKDRLMVLGGSSNPKLVNDVCKNIGIAPTAILCDKFSDGECQIEINDNVRGRDVFVIQSTCAPVNDNYMELFMILDALKRASAKSITAVTPYFGYARQDKKVKPRVPISAKVMADMLVAAGADRVVTDDLHANQIQGFFNIPVDNLWAKPVLVDHIKQSFNGDLVMVSPDAGGAERARSYAKLLNAGFAIIDKRRSAPNKAQAMNVLGKVKGKKAILLDDIIDTAGTLKEAAKALASNGAAEVYACGVHPVLSGPAIQRLNESVIKQVLVTDTIPLSDEGQACRKISVVSLANLIAEAIINIYKEGSISKLFE